MDFHPKWLNIIKTQSDYQARWFLVVSHRSPMTCGRTSSGLYFCALIQQRQRRMKDWSDKGDKKSERWEETDRWGAALLFLSNLAPAVESRRGLRGSGAAMSPFPHNPSPRLAADRLWLGLCPPLSPLRGWGASFNPCRHSSPEWGSQTSKFFLFIF